MPIEGLSDKRWLPRLGKIRLGIRKKGQGDKEYPEAMDYFVCPPEVQAVYGEKPTELKVMFVDNHLEVSAAQYYKCYSYSRGLICKGDGKTCHRKVDMRIGDFANKETGPVRGKDWEWCDAPCDGVHCPKQAAKQCKRVMTLNFMLPDVPGLGVWWLDTSSFYSIVNVNSQIGEEPPGFLRQFTRGRIAGLPLMLSVAPQEVNPPGEGRKTVHVLNIRSAVVLSELIEASRKNMRRILLPTLSEDEENEPPDDLFPTGLIGGRSGEPLSETDASATETNGHEQEPKEPVSVTETTVLSTKRDVSSTPAPVSSTRKAVAVNCECPKPVPAAEVVTRDHSAYHTKCAGYICTEPFDCFVGCPHMPQEKPAATGKLPPGWEKVTRDQVPDYLELEKIWCQLNPGKSTRDMYRRLGIGSRTDATIKAWDAFLSLKEMAKEPA